MDDKDREEFSELISALVMTFGKQPDAALLMGYWLGLRTLAIADLKRAVHRAFEECKFLPKPIELRELAGEVTPDERALLAWHALNSHIAIGPYKHVDFDDCLINATIRVLGGWPHVLTKTADEWEKWFRLDFLKTYAGFYRHGISGDVCRPLEGLGDTGWHDVLTRDGTISKCDLGRPVTVVTGLPPLPDSVNCRIRERSNDYASRRNLDVKLNKA